MSGENDDIFAELETSLSATMHSPYVGFLAPELIAETDSDDLRLIFEGLGKVIGRINHPDYIQSHSDQDLVTRAADETNSDSDVLAYRERLINGARTADKMRSLVEDAIADPGIAKVSALAEIHNNKGYVPSRAHISNEGAKPTGLKRKARRISAEDEMIALEDTKVEQEFEKYSDKIQSVRNRQEMLSMPEALHDISRGFIVCSDGEEGALFELTYGGEQFSREDEALDYRMIATPLDLVRPKKSITKQWSDHVFRFDPKIKAMDNTLLNDGGMRFAYDLKPDAEDSSHFGRSLIATWLDEVNKADQSFYEHPCDLFQLAVLNDRGEYVFHQTPLGKATQSRHVNTRTADIALTEWAIGVYGFAPDVLYVVDDQDAKTQNAQPDDRVLYAYKKTGDQRVLFSPDIYGLVTNNERANFRVRLLGYLNNVDQYREVNQNNDNEDILPLELAGSEDRLADTFIQLQDDLDVSLRSGFCNDFIPIRALHEKKRSRKTDTAIVVALELHESNSQITYSRDAFVPLEENRLFALRSPRALGVRMVEDQMEYDSLSPQEVKKIAQSVIQTGIDAAQEAVTKKFGRTD